MAESSVRRNPSGPLRYSTLVKINECLFWNKTKPPLIEPSDDDSFYLVKRQERQDFTAFTELGSSQLGWVIMERQDQNGDQMRLWPNDFYPGRRIQIPSRDSLSRRRIV
jgi:hypothetical protein